AGVAALPAGGRSDHRGTLGALVVLRVTLLPGPAAALSR
ncbi:hypothetical protein, partial [Cupriavidus sp. SK-4]